MSSGCASREYVDRLYLAMASDLAAAESGVAFIYRTLDRLVEEAGVADAVVVLDEPPAGHQLFRAGRRPVDADLAARLVRLAGPGLYTDPDLHDDELSTSVVSLCSVALRVDLLGHAASHDGLTGLVNRRSFDVALDQWVSRSKRYGWPFALALLDLNEFKSVNDRFGHLAGDNILRVIGTELRQSLRSGDMAFRMGGDEFAVILSNGAPEPLAAIVSRLEESVNQLAGDARISFAAGMALAPEESTDATALYRLADRRLYEAKGGR